MQKIRITLALILFTLVTLCSSHVYSSEPEPGTLLLKQSFPTESGKLLKLNSFAGNVKVNSWYKNELLIKIYGSREAMKCINFEVKVDKSGIYISACKKGAVGNAKALDLRYEIIVPRNYLVRVNDVKTNGTTVPVGID
jgi:hypothetical protein